MTLSTTLQQPPFTCTHAATPYLPWEVSSHLFSENLIFASQSPKGEPLRGRLSRQNNIPCITLGWPSSRNTQYSEVFPCTGWHEAPLTSQCLYHLLNRIDLLSAQQAPSMVVLIKVHYLVASFTVHEADWATYRLAKRSASQQWPSLDNWLCSTWKHKNFMHWSTVPQYFGVECAVMYQQFPGMWSLWG